jgi:hypothetical protein
LRRTEEEGTVNAPVNLQVVGIEFRQGDENGGFQFGDFVDLRANGEEVFMRGIFVVFHGVLVCVVTASDGLNVLFLVFLGGI